MNHIVMRVVSPWSHNETWNVHPADLKYEVAFFRNNGYTIESIRDSKGRFVAWPK